MSERIRTVILGASFGGLTVAQELRRLLPTRKREITVVSPDDRFVRTGVKIAYNTLDNQTTRCTDLL